MRRSSGFQPDAAARRSTSASEVPQHVVTATDLRSVAGSRPIAAHASSTRAYWAAASVGLKNGALNSWAKVAASRGVRRAPAPPMMIGGYGCWTGFGRAGLASKR